MTNSADGVASAAEIDFLTVLDQVQNQGFSRFELLQWVQSNQKGPYKRNGEAEKSERDLKFLHCWL